MDLLPLWYQYSIVFVFGLLIGSFLNVVLYRFHTGRSLAGSSHCLSCGTQLRWFELVPLFSYVVLRGRCRTCGCAVPLRYFLLESVTALLFLVVYMQFGMSVLSVLSVLLGIALLMIVVYDLYHMVIPDQLVIAVGICAAVYFVLMQYMHFSWIDLWHHAASAVAAFSVYGGLWLVSRGQWIGFGDAKLALPLGFILGPLGTFSFVVFSFWVGAVISLLLLFAPRVYHALVFVCSATSNYLRTCPHGSIVKYNRYLTMKSEVPFAPFMVIAFLLVYLYGIEVLDVTRYFL